ncbi:gram-negative bacteria-binding protein 2-like [Drosophila pseudoobscura]|uniref:Gram-negative bacteria-binding protein 2-like n=1 Tax=Drosophila pseudoobscura pseudoobscura TaxID=46245 RepID=A0A6I8V0W4_DROPS|nr:gram-negative bacteria-binding protein 2 [Drosophila pseudoobscura]
MKSRCVIFWLTSLLLGSLTALDLPAAVVKINNNELYISLPGQLEGVQSLLFQVEVQTDECVNNSYSYRSQSPWQAKMSLPKNIAKNAWLRVQTLVERTNNVISSMSSVYTVDKDGMVHLYVPGSSNKKIDVETLLSKCKPVEEIREGSVTESGNAREFTSGELLFEDNFDNGQSIKNNWLHEVKMRYTGGQNQEYVAFVSDPRNSYVSDNKLHIKIAIAKYRRNTYFKLKNCTSLSEKRTEECGPIEVFAWHNLPPAWSAKIHSNQFSFKFGRVEIRARMPKGNWLFPYLALQSKKNHFADNFADQIRLYARGNNLLQDKHHNTFDGRSLFGSALIWNTESDRQHTDYWVIKTNVSHYSEDFHDYTIIWKSDQIAFKVDGEFFGSITNSAILSKFNNDECYLVLGLTAGGAMNFDDEVLMKEHKKDKFSNTFPQAGKLIKEIFIKENWPQPTLVIDHVRVYAIDKYGN